MSNIIPYLTFADPHPDFTQALAHAYVDAGIQTIELGLPFSDPIADGPVIQASHLRALKNNPTLTLQHAFKWCHDFKKQRPVHFILMVTATLIYFHGIASFFKEASHAGISGLVIPDLILEDANPYLKYGKKYNVSVNLLVSPDIQASRLQTSVKLTQGFIYLISSVGLTGERAVLSDQLKTISQKIKDIRNVPVYLGFGIHTPEQVRFANTHMDGAIIGSHFVQWVSPFLNNTQQAVESLKKRIHELQG